MCRLWGWLFEQLTEHLLSVADGGGAIGTLGGNISGFATSLYFSISASCSLFAFARRFWNHIFTWVSVRLNEEENSARSAMDRYCFCLNFLSNASSCVVVKGVRGLRFVLCLRSWHLAGLICACSAEKFNGTSSWFIQTFHSFFSKFLRLARLKLLGVLIYLMIL